MKMDRAELAGTGAALAFHAALIAALTLSLAQVKVTPEPPSMEVEFVEDVGLEAAAPTSIATPPPASQAPETGEAPPDQPAPAPLPAATQPRIAPIPAPTPRPAPKAQAKPAQPKPAPRVSRIGDDFLKGIADSPSKNDAPAKPSAATFSATARANIGQAILRQVQPCADRQPFIGEDANQVRLTINLKLARSGRLIRPPTVIRTSGDPDLRAKYGDLLVDQVRRIFAQCTPLRLPAELYDTPTGGWNDFTFTYRVN
jgi:outer membrane biosynthesis protein TonB